MFTEFIYLIFSVSLGNILGIKIAGNCVIGNTANKGEFQRKNIERFIESTSDGSFKESRRVRIVTTHDLIIKESLKKRRKIQEREFQNGKRRGGKQLV